MAKKTDHVILRDGSANLGGPRPDPPERSPGPSRESPPAPKAFGPPYSDDDSTVGKFEVDRATFEDLHGKQVLPPRHELKPEPSKTAGPFPAPTD